jgi:hypothetical protein
MARECAALSRRPTHSAIIQKFILVTHSQNDYPLFIEAKLPGRRKTPAVPWLILFCWCFPGIAFIAVVTGFYYLPLYFSIEPVFALIGSISILVATILFCAIFASYLDLVTDRGRENVKKSHIAWRTFWFLCWQILIAPCVVAFSAMAISFGASWI